MNSTTGSRAKNQVLRGRSARKEFYGNTAMNFHHCLSLSSPEIILVLQCRSQELSLAFVVSQNHTTTKSISAQQITNYALALQRDSHLFCCLVVETRFYVVYVHLWVLVSLVCNHNQQEPQESTNSLRLMAF